MKRPVVVPMVLLMCLGTGIELKAQDTGAPGCEYVENGFGKAGETKIRVEKAVSGLEVPWAIGFLPGGDYLVTERPGRIRIVKAGSLSSDPVARVEVTTTGESGLLGLAVDPEFASNRYFYVYYTASSAGRDVNRVQRFVLSPERTRATPDKIILDGIPAAVFHDGGRIRFGPDGMLYVGTGDARSPSSAQDAANSAGKVLRITREGAIPRDNPDPASPVYISGVRNTQGFDWVPQGYVAVADHGPSGELGRSGHDELTFARAGANLGWPDTWRCEAREGITSPAIVWQEATPPGGVLYYSGDAVPSWKGSLLLATLRSNHLHRVIFAGTPPVVMKHEVYLLNQYGRLREIVQAPDGSIYITTSNCDGRGNCTGEKDLIIRITAGG